jgi:hypothetical protein
MLKTDQKELQLIYTKINFLIADAKKKEEILKIIRSLEENYDFIKKQITKDSLENLVKPFIEKHGQEMIDKFLMYWTQKNANGRKELWQMQRVFDVPKRLATWAGKTWNKPKESNIIVLHDGSRAIKKFDTWVDADNNSIKINTSYYPELRKL